jgi:hypothetical protein
MMISSYFGISVWLVVKVAALILLGLYFVFSLVVVKQIKLMTSTLTLGFEGLIIMLGYIHLAFAVLVFLFALVIL